MKRCRSCEAAGVTDVRGFHHAQLPKKSALLTGRFTPSDAAFRSDLLQVWFNETTSGWTDERAWERRSGIGSAVAGAVGNRVNCLRMRARS